MRLFSIWAALPLLIVGCALQDTDNTKPDPTPDTPDNKVDAKAVDAPADSYYTSFAKMNDRRQLGTYRDFGSIVKQLVEVQELTDSDAKKLEGLFPGWLGDTRLMSVDDSTKIRSLIGK